MITGCKFSPDRLHRYALPRVWDVDSLLWHGYVQFIGLNPSTADEVQDDPTIRRCRNFAKAWGYGGMVMTNAFGLRSTDPRGIYGHPDSKFPNGPQNDGWLVRVAADAAIVVCAWGLHGHIYGRQGQVLDLFRRLMPNRQLKCLGVTKGGFPRHPLYLSGTTMPMPFFTHLSTTATPGVASLDVSDAEVRET